MNLPDRRKKGAKTYKMNKPNWVKFVTKYHREQTGKNKNWTFKESLKNAKKMWKNEKKKYRGGGETEPNVSNGVITEPDEPNVSNGVITEPDEPNVYNGVITEPDEPFKESPNSDVSDVPDGHVPDGDVPNDVTTEPDESFKEPPKNYGLYEASSRLLRAKQFIDFTKEKVNQKKNLKKEELKKEEPINEELRKEELKIGGKKRNNKSKNKRSKGKKATTRKR